MEPQVASRTALGTSLMRALHTRADPEPILQDPWGDRLVPAEIRRAVQARALAELAAQGLATGNADPQALTDTWLRRNGAYCTVMTRSRYAEDALLAAVARGVRQYLLLGAGFDSFALRTPPQARHVEIFEIDHPATQGLKRRCIELAGLTLRPEVHFLAADLAEEQLADVLARAPGFRRDEPAFIAWLGVTMYLPRTANDATLRALAACTAPGSELVFTYIDQAAFTPAEDDANPVFRALQASVQSMGEPFLCGLDPQQLPTELAALGFELLADCSDLELVARYDPQDRNRLLPSALSRLAHARVVQQPAARR